MKKTCDNYAPEDMSRFVDNELPPNLHREFAQHLIHCPSCSRVVEQYRSITSVFSGHADQEVLKIDGIKLKQKLEKSLQNSEKTTFGNVFGLLGKNIYLKLASITAILMISLFAFQGSLFGPSGPSAIVKSVNTDFTSVMIIETQKEKHTIIWFSET
ncbi:MAG: zf-HC2 domain-containing protein [Proteobacteria bacterium]|nr:zf-HC2 domain-containing protein [Pseudomonadota bacterium]MBU1585062.1 zf-HC2 domain-containing protein [Pseudomonadota bacterium]MBU2455873.1 zf-HC2 domain-containing protein [Pseudomonadota bacterium]MBU2629563.1 zf-HC2 domain-containing protein [Pseudomonadota bacterium]